jgi:16S rRNA (guanine1516-N2)-methyltransferase
MISFNSIAKLRGCISEVRLLSTYSSGHDGAFRIHRDDDGKITGLSKISVSREKPFCIDFTSPRFQQRIKQANSELVVKAVGKASLIVDLTAGLGRDGMMLAATGKQIVMVEEQLVLAEMLQSALSKLSNDPKHCSLYSRIKLIAGNSLNSADLIQSYIDERGETAQSISVYLDPMYPQKSTPRKSLVKKETQWLHLLAKQFQNKEEEDNFHIQLFLMAKRFATDRIVVKRPMNALSLVRDPQPHATISGRDQRFDVYFVHQLQKSSKSLISNH